jgi:hypothetical protein
LRVRWFKEVFDRVTDADQEFYGLAWATAATALGAVAIPEPASATLLMILALVFGLSRRALRSDWHRWLVPPLNRTTTALACATVTAVLLVPPAAAESATIEFDSTAKSPAVSQIDPDATFEASNGYISGRVPREVKGPITGGTNINTFLGADAFYSQGFKGANAVIATIEAGHVWNGHETLTHAQQITKHPSVLNEFDWHNTVVGMILAGRRGGANPGAYQEGMAPDAQLFSGAMATQWNGLRYTPNSTDNYGATVDQYRRAFATGVNASGRRADVISSSWHKLDTATANGSDSTSIAFDGLANDNPRTLFVIAAGNDGPGPDKVTAPASGYNNLSVAALGPNPPYDRAAWFSSGGPNDYADPVNGMKNDARQTVDIAAPGDNLSAAYYGGETGGNGTTDNPAVSGPGPSGLPSGSLGGPDYYSRGGLSGTSFATPTVSGGAALLYDAAYTLFPDNGDARDARVMKSVLMNAADKTIGWDNGQVSHPNGNGGVLTTQALDNRVGTGRLNLDAAYDQFLAGSTDVAGTSSGDLGVVNEIGWDFGQVVSGTTNDYFFDSSLTDGSMLTATLTWFRDRRINLSNTIFDDSYDDLNLELWSVIDGVPTSLISESSSLYNESEHFAFTIPSTGDYALRVRWFKEVFDRVTDTDQEFYGLAWATAVTGLNAIAIPEPASAILFATAALTCGISRRGITRRRVDR